MVPTAVDVGAIVLLILPGFLAYRFAVWRSTDPSLRSPLWQLAEILEYSVYVHLSGAALVAALLFFLRYVFGITTHLQELLQSSPGDFLRAYFVEAVLWFTIYPAYVIISSAILGAYNAPVELSARIVQYVKRSTGWLSAKCRLLRWIPVPKEAYPQDPVWYYAFNTMTQGYTSERPFVFVTLKSGDVYYGQLATYPIVPDTQQEKDFLIVRALYYKDGDANNEQNLYDADGVGAVLLNTANVDSIIIYYNLISPD